MQADVDRVWIIEQSLRCFVYGWLGVIPVLGVAPAIRTLVLSAQIRRRLGETWNPADRYRRIGVCIAAFGIIGTFIGVLICAAIVLHHSS